MGCNAGCDSATDFAAARRERCKACTLAEWKDGVGICQPTASKHGTDKADIEHGVIRPELRCPEGKWEAVEASCPKCRRPKQMLSVTHRVCKWCVIKHGLGKPNAIRERASQQVSLGGGQRRGSSFRATGEPQWVSLQQLAIDVQQLASMIPHDVTAIVGVARSGITPASMVASLLHLPLLSIRQTLGDVIEVGNGWRLGGNHHVSPHGKVAIIDDTVMTGNSLKAIAHVVSKQFPRSVTCAIYVNPLAKRKPDLWVHDLGWPHILEWNVFNSVLSPNVAVDFDGILCHDCPRGSDDDGPRYLDFIRNAKPLYVPRKVPIPLIVTARIEKYREETEAWLRRHRINFYNLVMHPAATLAERQRDDIAAYKAKHFEAWASKHIARPAPLMFIESEDWQARKIASITGRMVVCPATHAVYQSGSPSQFSTDAVNVGKHLQSAASYAPSSMDDHCIAVTALSEHPQHLHRQGVCLDSWKGFGLSIIAVNTLAEIASLKHQYPQVDRWIESDTLSVGYDTPTQQIRRLLQVSVEIDKPVLLMNSDIEIHGTQSQLIDRIKPNTLLGGIRFDYQESVADATRQPYGIDAFCVTPEMAATLPDLPMGIGKPTWDYWLPYHFRELGYEIDLIGEPLFYHRFHPTLWREEEWSHGASMIADHYGYDMDTARLTFRQMLPYPPD